MKKFVVFILILALILPAASLAADRDPILGSGYLIFDATLYPELKAEFDNYDLIIMVYSFMEDGTVIQTENDIKEGTSNQNCRTVGKWEKDGDKYTYSIVGLGTGDLTMDNEKYYLKIRENHFMIFRRMVEYNPYTDTKH